MIVNPYCRDLGWLFEDLKRAFERVVDDHCGYYDEFYGVHASTDGAPQSDADAHIALRSWEITPATPHPERHVIQFHSLEPRFAGDPATLNKCAAFVFVHPDQPVMLERLGVSLDKPCLLRPIGAPSGLRLRSSLPDVFTVGWAGRDTNNGSATEGKRVGLFVQAVKELHQQGVAVRAALFGAQLEPQFDELEASGIRCDWHPREAGDPYSLDQAQVFYDSIDVLCITSERETGPMPLFEALACGVPVVSFEGIGWSGDLLMQRRGGNGYEIAEAPSNAAALDIGLRAIHGARERHFTNRHLVRASLMGFSLEGWIEDNVRLAMEVAHQ